MGHPAVQNELRRLQGQLELIERIGVSRNSIEHLRSQTF